MVPEKELEKTEVEGDVKKQDLQVEEDLKNDEMKRSIKPGNDYKMICIKVVEPDGKNTYHRMIRGIARRLVKDDPKITYTTRSRWKKYVRKGE